MKNVWIDCSFTFITSHLHVIDLKTNCLALCVDNNFAATFAFRFDVNFNQISCSVKLCWHKFCNLDFISLHSNCQAKFKNRNAKSKKAHLLKYCEKHVRNNITSFGATQPVKEILISTGMGFTFQWLLLLPTPDKKNLQKIV